MSGKSLLEGRRGDLIIISGELFWASCRNRPSAGRFAGRWDSIEERVAVLLDVKKFIENDSWDATNDWAVRSELWHKSKWYLSYLVFFDGRTNRVVLNKDVVKWISQ